MSRPHSSSCFKTQVSLLKSPILLTVICYCRLFAAARRCSLLEPISSIPITVFSSSRSGSPSLLLFCFKVITELIPTFPFARFQFSFGKTYRGLVTVSKLLIVSPLKQFASHSQANPVPLDPTMATNFSDEIHKYYTAAYKPFIEANKLPTSKHAKIFYSDYG